jgi:Uma2 family endonuclease
MRTGSLAWVPPDAPRMTLEEWSALEEDAPGEIVDGRLVEEEVPDGVHETVLAWLFFALTSWARGHDARVVGSGLKYAVSKRSGRMPDLSVFLGGRKPPPRGLVKVPPDIAVEIVSPHPSDARRDRVEKTAEYAAFGIRWYWIVDPSFRTIEILELRDGAYAHVGAASAGTASDLPGCEGLSLDMDALWAEVDALGD